MDHYTLRKGKLIHGNELIDDYMNAGKSGRIFLFIFCLMCQITCPVKWLNYACSKNIKNIIHCV